MPKYYCDYCKSYLTHDKPSVRKSHLVGKNHIKWYCQHYETKAKEQGLWNPSDMEYEITVGWVNRNAPGAAPASSAAYVQRGGSLDPDAMLPPPLTLPGMPNPPPAVVRDVEREQKAAYHAKPKEFQW
ncbi:U1 small nuclear ribonucleoprotein C [Diutina catenulata]